MTNSYSLKEIQLLFAVPQHVLIHLCEKGVIKPEIADPQGRGKSREFSKRNIFEFAVALELRKYEIPVLRIAAILKFLESFEKSLKKSIKEFELPDSLHKGPNITFYLFNGEQAVFALGKNSFTSFQLDKLIAGDSKRIQLESLDSLPTTYTSYLKLDLQKLSQKIV